MKKLLAIAAVLLLIAVPALAQEIDYCEGDFDCDGDCDGTDASVFKSDFGRSSFQNPCPNCVPIKPIIKTNQMNCYDMDGVIIDCAGTGQDGEHQKGYDRFTDHGDGTVSDNFTGLMWTKDGQQVAGKMNWQDALTSCNNLDLADYDDWRLPNIQEQQSLVEYTVHWILPQGHPFTNVDINGDGFYWSSTTKDDQPNHALCMLYHDGYWRSDAKFQLFNVWCVRGGQSGSIPTTTIPTTTTTINCIQQGGNCTISSECCDGCCCNALELNVCTTTEQCGFLGGGCD